MGLRNAYMADADLLLEWRNDPETRRASHNMDVVKRDEHMAWLAKTLENPNRELYIFEHNGAPAGTVRADYDGKSYELSWTVAPPMRGCGVGKQMVLSLAKQLKAPIRAEIKPENRASICIAEYAGMHYSFQKDNILHYQRKEQG